MTVVCDAHFVTARRTLTRAVVLPMPLPSSSFATTTTFLGLIRRALLAMTSTTPLMA